MNSAAVTDAGRGPGARAAAPGGERPEAAEAPVPLLDPRRGHAALGPALQAAFARVLAHGQFILGAEVEALEAALAERLGSPAAIGVSSGSDALLVALLALGVGRGDEVVCPTYTFFATAGSIWRAGARPRFVDSCPGCFNLLPAAAAAACGPRTRALMPVHLFGQLAAAAPLMAAAAAAGVPLVEDAAQALGAGPPNAQAGTLGALGCTSFFPSKNLGGLGDGGMVFTGDAALAQRCRVLRGHGAAPKYHHALVGGNFRLDALQAALLAVKLPHLGAAQAARQANARRYGAMFAATGLAAPGRCRCGDAAAGRGEADDDAPILLPTAHREGHVYNQYVVRLTAPGRRDQVLQALRARGIGCEVYYPVPLHLQACFAALGHRAGDFPHAERLAAQSLALPIYAELRADEQARVVAAVAAACRA